jgi:hypothetical protein
MPKVGFELTIQAFERAKTVHALEREVTVFGADCLEIYKTGEQVLLGILV